LPPPLWTWPVYAQVLLLPFWRSNSRPRLRCSTYKVVVCRSVLRARGLAARGATPQNVFRVLASAGQVKNIIRAPTAAHGVGVPSAARGEQRCRRKSTIGCALGSPRCCAYGDRPWNVVFVLIKTPSVLEDAVLASASAPATSSACTFRTKTTRLRLMICARGPRRSQMLRCPVQVRTDCLGGCLGGLPTRRWPRRGSSQARL